jgi:hypothetical protein
MEKYFEEPTKIVVNIKDYNQSQDIRLLIPFIARNNKIGLLNHNGNVVLKPHYDIILDDCYSEDDIIRVGTISPYGYLQKNGEISVYKQYKYKAINSKGGFITNGEFLWIGISSDNKHITVQDLKKNYAVFDCSGNEIVPFGKYSWIDCFDQGLSRVIVHKDQKKSWGIINTKGEEVLPPEYDNIWSFFGKNRDSTKVIKNGNTTNIYFKELNPELHIQRKHKFVHSHDRYGTHYGEYEGSYAQEIMGYSDDVINDAFEGDPDAYWNID